MSSATTTTTKTTEVNKELVHTTAKKLCALSESSRRKVFDELDSKSESKAVNEIVSIAQSFSKSEIAALKREMNRKRPRKDPNAPKGPSGPYLHYSKTKVQELKNANEKLTHKDATKRCGELWNAMSDEEKAPFVKMAEEDKARYVEEREVYEREHADEIREFEKLEGKRPKKAKDPNAPKRNCNAFMHFSPAKVRELKEEKNLTHKQATSLAGKLWKAMTDEEKQPFVDAAEEDRKRYTEELVNYNGGATPTKVPATKVPATKASATNTSTKASAKTTSKTPTKKQKN